MEFAPTHNCSANPLWRLKSQRRLRNLPSQVGLPVAAGRLRKCYRDFSRQAEPLRKRKGCASTPCRHGAPRREGYNTPSGEILPDVEGRVNEAFRFFWTNSDRHVILPALPPCGGRTCVNCRRAPAPTPVNLTLSDLPGRAGRPVPCKSDESGGQTQRSLSNACCYHESAS